LKKSVAIYSRKSKFTGKGESIENQIELCKQYIDNAYDKESIELFIYEDEGFSAKNTFRPQFQTMLQEAKKKKFSVLVCYRLDRISRNVSDFANLIEELHQLGVDFVSIKEKFDTSNPMGRAMMYISSVFAQLERETIAERIRDNMYELSKTGRWLGGTTPTGYTSESIERVSVDGKLKKACKLKIIPEEAQMISLIFKTYLDTGSLTKTDAYLIQKKYKTKNKKYFTRFAIRSILSNPVYMIADQEAYRYVIDKGMNLFSEEKSFDGKRGLMVYNRTQQRDGRAHRVNSMQEWIVSVGKHEGIITGNDWIKVQELLSINQSKSYRKPRSNTAILSGVLICGNCGDYMRPKMSKGYTENGNRSFYYLCNRKEKSHGDCCNMINLNGNNSDAAIWEELCKLFKVNTYFIRQMESLYQSFERNKKEHISDLVRLKKLMKENEKEISLLVNALALSTESTANQYILKQIEEYHEKREQLQKQLEEAEAQNNKNEASDTELSAIVSCMFDATTLFDKASVESRRRMIRKLVKKAVWDGVDVHLYYDNEVQEVFPSN
jgi:DNA invertase Pin-like site-specific DNA recombinase